MTPSLAETIYADFITSSPTTGAAVDADSTPTCEVFEDNTDTAILSPTVVKRTGKTGDYRIPIVCTAGNGFEAGKSYNVIASATVGGVAAKAVVQTFQIRTNDDDDIAAFIDTEVGAIKAKTDNLPIDPADASDIAASFVTVNGTLATLSGYVDTEIAAILAKVNNLPVDPADASDIAASFAGVNTKLDTIDDFVDTEIGAIKLKTDNLPSDPASTAAITAQFSATNSKIDVVDDFLDTEIAAIKTKTDQMTFTGGKIDANATLAIAPTDLNAIADALLKRDWNSVTGEAAYSALNAFRMLRNVWTTAGGILTVKKEDGITTAWNRALTTDPTAQPITGAT